MRVVPWLGLVLLGGCDLVFRIESNCGATTVTPVADGFLQTTNATTNFGGRTLVDIGAGLATRGLFRYQLPVPTTQIVGLTLTLHYAPVDEACSSGTGCAPCAAFDQTGTLRLYPMRSDWGEREFDANCRFDSPTCVSWGTLGAVGADDRGSVIATATHTAATDTTLAVAGTALEEALAWVDADSLALLVDPDPGARMIVAAHEYACGPVPSAELAIDSCR